MQCKDLRSFDVVVVGAGPAGLITGLAAAHIGLSVAVVGPAAGGEDTRTAALMDGSVRVLEDIGIWPLLVESAAPLAAMRLVDATGSLLAAPEVTFQAREIGLPAFGYNVPNAALTNRLEAACAQVLERFTSQVTRAAIHETSVQLTLSDGTEINARLVAAADGRNSAMREAAGIAVSTWTYDQAAIVTSFTHSRPHGGISTEFHRRPGPLTVVPTPGNASSLVWVETRAEAERLAKLDDQNFVSALAPHLHGLLGTLGQIAPRRVFPLQGQTANVLAQRRIALVGEAAHVMPPIGAQGLNLSIRDGLELARSAGAAKAAGQDPGADDVLRDYEAQRRPDITSRVWTVDLLNRSLIAPYAPLHLLRGAGLVALAGLGPLRRYVMREGVGSSTQISLPGRNKIGRAETVTQSTLDVSGSRRA